MYTSVALAPDCAVLLYSSFIIYILKVFLYSEGFFIPKIFKKKNVVQVVWSILWFMEWNETIIYSEYFSSGNACKSVHI